jgi:MerR family glutamine synthetase transcriptional repressor
MSDEIRRNMALFPMGIVMKLTDLTARQIRYYEQHKLIQPSRTSGNQRLFSFNDVDRLLEIKSLIEKGINIAGIKEMMSQQEKADQQLYKAETDKKRKNLTDKDLHQLLKQQLAEPLRPGEFSLNHGDMSRFFH